MPWNFNASAPKKDIDNALDTEYKKFEATQHYSGQMDIVKPIVKLVLEKYPAQDETLIDVAVASGGVNGRTGVNINVTIH